MPAAASVSARLHATVDLPSPGSGLVTTIVFGGWSTSMNCRLVRSARNASETAKVPFLPVDPDVERIDEPGLAVEAGHDRDGADDGDPGPRLDVLRRADAPVGHRADHRERDAEAEAEDAADDHGRLHVGEDRRSREATPRRPGGS